MLKLSFIITINVHNIYAVLVFSMFILAGSDVYTAVLLSRPADRVRVWNTARAASADIDGHQKRDVCISCNTERILSENRLKILREGPCYSPRLHYELNSCGEAVVLS